MVKLLDNSKISKFNYFYMMCMLIYLGSATVFARSLGNIVTWGNTFALIITAIAVKKNHIRFDKSFSKSIAVFLLYAAATTVNNGLLSPMWIMQWLIWLFITYCLCRTFNDKLFVVLETAMFHLCVISLVFWVIHIVSPQLIKVLFATFKFSTPHGGAESNVVGNIIFYTLNRGDINEYTFVTRNAGFAWEPGAFASYICLAIVCNSLRTNFRLKNNKSLIVLIITLLTTQSTTGFMAFIVMICVWLIIGNKYWYSFIIVPIAIYLFQLPFVQEKMLMEFGNLEIFDLSLFSDSGTYTLGRMSSFLLDWEEFLRHPILGLGGWQGGTWLNQFGYENIATISGIGEMLAMYGAIMTILFFYLLIKSTNLVAKTMSKNGYLFIVVIVGMMISYAMWHHPIYMSVWMYVVFSTSKKKEFIR